MFVKGGTALRDSFDLTIAVVCGFSEYMYKGENPAGKGERSASPDSNEPLRYGPP
ncbi:hypothetical protein ACYCS5_00480 [Paenibacillus sp. SEL3]|uniref:hypothetical protein n=1 Tax=Paenibacillus TaxID=44249 RepID=UPI00040FDC76|nr:MULTISPECIES: hypothetical protein [Paenibacillus]MBP1307179.1 hypothetical protein [Paenibacillus sp. 1182]